MDGFFLSGIYYVMENYQLGAGDDQYLCVPIARGVSSRYRAF